MAKVRTNIIMDRELIEFIKNYAKSQKTSVSAIFTQFVLAIKRTKENNPTEIILSNPDFTDRLLSTIAKIKTGEMKWYGYDEVFK